MIERATPVLRVADSRRAEDDDRERLGFRVVLAPADAARSQWPTLRPVVTSSTVPSRMPKSVRSDLSRR